MLARSVARCSNRLRTPVLRPCLRFARPQCRRFSMHASGATPGSAPMSSAGMLAPFVGELDRIAPSFKINGSQIRVLQSPAEFYETLKDKIRHAERRIFLSTLYIGKSERELVRARCILVGSVVYPDLPRSPPCKRLSVRNPSSDSASSRMPCAEPARLRTRHAHPF